MEGDAVGILDLPLAMLFGNGKERFDRVRTDRQADLRQAHSTCDLKVFVQPTEEAQAHGGKGRQGVEELFALLARVVIEPVNFEAFLTVQKRAGIAPEVAEKGFTSGQLLQSGSQLG
jgi:hypothetical protein